MSPETFDKFTKNVMTELRLNPKWGTKHNPLISEQEVPWALYNAANKMGLLDG